ncbi:hypothetical protein LY78DRAFT_425329 [Colletotrichum sublineola]|nr:hypothetical protein LY78DRAFT_425329 [Colletotrichum sublineola]
MGFVVMGRHQEKAQAFYAPVKVRKFSWTHITRARARGFELERRGVMHSKPVRRTRTLGVRCLALRKANDTLEGGEEEEEEAGVRSSWGLDNGISQLTRRQGTIIGADAEKKVGSVIRSQRQAPSDASRTRTAQGHDDDDDRGLVWPYVVIQLQRPGSRAEYVFSHPLWRRRKKVR